MKKKLIAQGTLTVKEYTNTVLEIKAQIQDAQARGFASLNMLINQRNWIIGQIVTKKQIEHQWGSNFLDKLAQDLQNLFPENGGLSKANIYRMMAFYRTYSNFRTAVRKIENLPIFSLPWSHNIMLLQSVKNPEESLWYAQKALENGWSRSMLEKQIASNLYKREGKAISNFAKTVPSSHSAMVQESFKDPYCFDFLSLQDAHIERDLEQGLMNNVEKLLLEMGKGFSLVARQYHVQVGPKDYYIDLLFYHIKLKRYIVIELKAKEFDPRDVGQINFYLTAIDEQLRDKNDHPTIGLILCRTKDNLTVEYALRNIKIPVGVASYEAEIVSKLPKELQSSLPTIQELEFELEKAELLKNPTKPKATRTTQQSTTSKKTKKPTTKGKKTTTSKKRLPLKGKKAVLAKK